VQVLAVGLLLVKVDLQLEIIPVQSAQPALFAGQFAQTLVPGLYCGGVVEVEHTVIAAQERTPPPLVTTAGVDEAQPHMPADGVFRLKVAVQVVHEPDGPLQAVQFRGQFVQTPFAFMY